MTTTTTMDDIRSAATDPYGFKLTADIAAALTDPTSGPVLEDGPALTDATGGDLVLVATYHRHEWGESFPIVRVHTVTRATRTQVTLSNGGRYSRASGTAIAGAGRGIAWPLTVDQVGRLAARIREGEIELRRQVAVADLDRLVAEILGTHNPDVIEAAADALRAVRAGDA